MRKRRRSAALTARWRSESGSIALEASLTLPIVLMVIIFFICLIRLNAAQMALHGAVSQTARQAAANIHPIDLAVNRLAESGNGADSSGGTQGNPTGNGDSGGEVSPGEFSDGSPVSPGGPRNAQSAGSSSDEPLPAVEYLADKLEEWLPSPAGPLLSAALKGDWQSIRDTAAATVGRPVIEPLLRREADASVLDPERIRLTKLSLPDLKDKTDLTLTIEAEYSFPLGFPFTKKAIVLRERAEERVWTPDTVPAPRGGASDDEHAPIQIVLVEPSPARPGHKARVVVKTSPGRSLSIQVRYKSGNSVAKHLGDTVTDSEGLAEWTWLVSGNTTPGVWEIVVTASDGGSAARHFVIQKKPKEGENG
ncbi:TadE/TadG family type IV pilus assembly protein [Paenibacillus sp. GCM10023250]|uniref:TadE/TadG family type IV pilus assembly protein n=1 Tax=Paenibacillus sp. GCM10023250 TaxID=3252648 RepID=UPI00360A1132